MVIGIDIGYGDTKVCNGEKLFKFPTAVAKQRNKQADFGKDDNGVYLYNGNKYIIDKNAVSTAITTRGFDFLIKYAPLLAYHAIVTSDIDQNNLDIVTGLSIVNWKRKDEYLNALSRIVVDDKVLIPQKVFLMAQGQGVLNQYQGSKKGLTCVVDIGYNTFDFLVFENGKPRADLSFATKQGTNLMITDLQALIKNRFDFEVSEAEAKEIFEKKEISIFAEVIDLSDNIDDAIITYNDFIINEIKSKRIDILRQANAVIFAGGGAYYLIGEKLPKNVVFIDKPYEYANVKGYCHK